jgi:hypothetical protein
VDQATFATARKDIRVILTFLTDAKVGVASIPFDSCVEIQQRTQKKNICMQILMTVLLNYLHVLAARTHLEATIVRTRDP